MTGPEALEREVTGLASELIRIDTSNPPGNETPAAEHLAAYLEGAGIECELAGPDPARLNLIARVPGRGEGPSLMFMAHTDVVPAPPEGWSVDPFAGVVADGHLIGRGAADMKGELAARAVALAELARADEAPPGDVVLVAQADEERNQSDVGMSWLVRERPDLRCDFAIDEGGGALLELDDGTRVVTVAVGEKRVTSLRLRLHGTGGHASAPSSDNPVGHAATAVERLVAYRPPPRIQPTVARALEVLGCDPADPGAIETARSRHPWLRDEVPAMTLLTVNPTGLEAGEPPNVVPGHADVICDCRTLPGDTEDDVRAHVAAALGDDIEYELEFLEPLAGGTESPIDTPLYAAIERFVAERLDGAGLLPLLSVGFADIAWVRGAWDTVAYGFAPIFATDLETYDSGAHATDETIAVADLVEMAAFHVRAAAELSSLSSR